MRINNFIYYTQPTEGLNRKRVLFCNISSLNDSPYGMKCRTNDICSVDSQGRASFVHPLLSLYQLPIPAPPRPQALAHMSHARFLCSFLRARGCSPAPPFIALITFRIVSFWAFLSLSVAFTPGGGPGRRIPSLQRLRFNVFSYFSSSSFFVSRTKLHFSPRTH
jgi:hypothetical protein